MSVNLRYYLVLLAELLVFHRKVLFESGWLFPWDFRGVHLPLATFVADSLRRGQWPLWDPYTYCGNPIYANIQTALFYPPVLLAMLTGAWLGPGTLPKLLMIAVIGQVWFAGIWTFALVRRLGAPPAAAWIAATIYELGCFFTSQAEHMGAMHAAAWLPLIWLSVVHLRQGFSRRWLALLSGALAMSVLAGLPQVAVAAFGSAIAFAVLLALYRLAKRALPLHVLAACACALLLAAIQVIPTFELTRHSVAKYRAEWLKSGGGIPWQSLPSLVVPNYWSVFDPSKFHGPTDLTLLYLYGSLLGLALAISAIVWKPGLWARAVGALTLLSAIWMFGDSTPIGATIFQILPPTIRTGIHPEFTLCVFALGFAVLAGLGAGRLPRTQLQVAAGVVIFVDLLLTGSNRPFNTSSLAAEPGIQRDSVNGSRDLVTRLRTLTGTEFPPYRFDMSADIEYDLSSTAPLLRIPTANGCDPLAPERIIQIRLSFAPGPRWGTCFQVVNFTSPVIPLTNARYLLSRSPLSEPHLKLAAEVDGFRIFENQHTLPRYFFVSRSESASGLREAAAMLHRADFNPAESAIVEGLPPATFAAGRVEVLSYGPTIVKLNSHAEGKALLIAADAWYPGWQASIDGKPAELYIADVAFRGIPVPAGDHRVEMHFSPRILYLSAAITFVTLAALAIAVRNRPRKAHALNPIGNTDSSVLPGKPLAQREEPMSGHA